MQAGGKPTFSSALSTAVGGYPKGAVILGSDKLTLWQSQVNSNTSDPDVTPTNWKKVDVDLRQELAGTAGFSLVWFKPSGVAGAVKRALSEWLQDGLIANVKWFGAKGDWNCGPAQTGTDDTASVLSAVTFLATLGSRRSGAVRRLFFPMGNYRLKSMPLPIGISFALNIYGEGNFASQLFFDNTDPSIAIDCVIESINFSKIGLFGSLSDSAVGDPASWKDVGFKGRNAFNSADVDVKFESCSILFWKEFANAYGRGVVFDNCEIGQVNTLLNIVCDPTIVFFPSPQALGSVETGMRNYAIRNCRTDQILVSLLRVTGTGPQKEYINDISIHGNDFVATEKLIDAPDAFLRMLSVAGNSALLSFRGGVVSARRVYSPLIGENNLARRYEATIPPTTFQDCIPYILTTTEEMHDVNVHDNIVRNLSGNAVSTDGSASNVTIKDNTFPNGWTFFEPSSNICHIFFSPGNCPGLQIDGNQFSSTVTSRTYRAFNPAAQTDKNTFIGPNPAPWAWVDSRLSYQPVLLVNGVAASVPPSGRSGRYYFDGKFIHFDVMIISAFTEVTGALSITCPPVAPVAESQSLSGSYGGGADVMSHSGFTSAGNVFSRCVVNPVTQRIELYKEGGMVRTTVNAADKTGTITLYISGKYRA